MTTRDMTSDTIRTRMGWGTTQANGARIWMFIADKRTGERLWQVCWFYDADGAGRAA